MVCEIYEEISYFLPAERFAHLTSYTGAHPLGGAFHCEIYVANNVPVDQLLEPISKSSEEDNEACELDKAEEVLSVVLPADEYATLPLYPGEEALDEPAPLVTA